MAVSVPIASSIDAKLSFIIERNPNGASPGKMAVRRKVQRTTPISALRASFCSRCDAHHKMSLLPICEPDSASAWRASIKENPRRADTEARRGRSEACRGNHVRLAGVVLRTRSPPAGPCPQPSRGTPREEAPAAKVLRKTVGDAPDLRQRPGRETSGRRHLLGLDGDAEHDLRTRVWAAQHVGEAVGVGPRDQRLLDVRALLILSVLAEK